MVQERFDAPDMRASFAPLLQQSEAPDNLMKEMEEYLDNILGANL
jgi:hypothetical protein